MKINEKQYNFFQLYFFFNSGPKQEPAKQCGKIQNLSQDMDNYYVLDEKKITTTEATNVSFSV